jgi:hypothetical protein
MRERGGEVRERHIETTTWQKKNSPALQAADELWALNGVWGANQCCLRRGVRGNFPFSDKLGRVI